MMIFVGLVIIFILVVMVMDWYFVLNKFYFYSVYVNLVWVKYVFLILLIVVFVMVCFFFIGVGDNVYYFLGIWCFFDYYGIIFWVKLFVYMYSVLGFSVFIVIIIFNFVVF